MPPYLLGRRGLIMLGSHALFVLGMVVLAIGLTLQAGATSAVKTIKMSVKLASGGAGPPTARHCPAMASLWPASRAGSPLRGDALTAPQARSCSHKGPCHSGSTGGRSLGSDQPR
jgi:hypothetical protein